MRYVLFVLLLPLTAVASGLPPTTSEVKDFEYSSNPTITGYSPGTATVSLFSSFILLYGAPTGATARELEFFDILNADVCYSTTCPSMTPLYPLPNDVLTPGSIVFRPSDIVAGTGVSSVNTDFAISGALFHGVGGPATGETITADGKPVVFTGDDTGGLSSFLYFHNADGTVSPTLHVLRNTTGSATLVGVILDPPQTLVFDIIGFTNLGPNTSVTATLPEPGTWQLVLIAACLLAGVHWFGNWHHRTA
jgi:hypothetical protein